MVVARAMKALNSKGIVHRDLKPGNILLSHSGKPNPSPTEITLKIGMSIPYLLIKHLSVEIFDWYEVCMLYTVFRKKPILFYSLHLPD